MRKFSRKLWLPSPEGMYLSLNKEFILNFNLHKRREIFVEFTDFIYELSLYTEKFSLRVERGGIQMQICEAQKLFVAFTKASNGDNKFPTTQIHINFNDVLLFH